MPSFRLQAMAMAKRSNLKNTIRTQILELGRATFELRYLNGEVISSFGSFMRKISSYPLSTRKSYALPVSLFIDYLIEANAFGHIAAQSYLNSVIDTYPILLRDGSAVVAARTLANMEKRPQDGWLTDVARALDRSPISPNSFDNILAGINHYLDHSKELATEAFDYATLNGINHEGSYSRLIESLNGSSKLSWAEVRAMSQNSMLGSVVRTRRTPLSRPRRLSIAGNRGQHDAVRLDFPIELLLAVVSVAQNKRDALLWLLIGGCGLRPSEALNLLWEDIDILKQRIYIYDPRDRHFGGDLPEEQLLKFKGRNMSMTHFIQVFRIRFFELLVDYLKYEYVPPMSKSDARYVFQFVGKGSPGVPYLSVSAKTLCQSFARACKRAKIPSPRTSKKSQWTLKSLRHMFGVYMLNDIPIDAENGIFGLELTEVQMLMGHADASATRVYARKKRRNLQRKLEASDQSMRDLGLDGDVCKIESVNKG
jgi:integrase